MPRWIVKRRADQSRGHLWQPGVRVQEEQDIATRRPPARIHLRRAAARRELHPVAELPCSINRSVRAAAVHDNDFDFVSAQRFECAQSFMDSLRFIEGRENDRDHWCHATKNAPVAIECWIGRARRKPQNIPFMVREANALRYAPAQTFFSDED
jgi:hypothetical protein